MSAIPIQFGEVLQVSSIVGDGGGYPRCAESGGAQLARERKCVG